MVFQVEEVAAHVGEFAELGQDLGDELPVVCIRPISAGDFNSIIRGPHTSCGMSPETLRKIETGRLPTPAFGTIACLSEVLDLPTQDLAAAWRNGSRLEAAS